MARAGIAAGAVDLFHDDAGFDQAKARAAVVLGDQRRHPAFARQGIDKFLGIGAFVVYFAMIFRRELCAKRFHTVADILILVVQKIHSRLVLGVVWVAVLTNLGRRGVRVEIYVFDAGYRVGVLLRPKPYEF